ncbi:serine/threonine-protein kinase ATR [Scaptodrosophila lebanonensis]|uniref:Serine/threonine-protein kinase ATR n=1 Tax=Drosophila lebanonensis TaxID=7225 RepID=A0A6J2U495_DROLE|nr:serine/threonine-protein kinase ATR [Scaptodrosophila lebanonensis]
MSHRRKEMWKLLYNLVNGSETNLMAMYSVVDDILCQEPSLISCSSVRELNNKFQDTIVLWLLNKLAKCLSRCTIKGCVALSSPHSAPSFNLNEPNHNHCLKNVQLQQKILTSCWANHPKLYEELVLAYIDALQQLNEQLGNMDYSEANREAASVHVFQLNIFTRDISCLQEFDAKCAFQTIEIPLDNADAYAKHLLAMLKDAHCVGYATHGEVFVDSLTQALLTLKECDMDTKLACLRYCHAVLRVRTNNIWPTTSAIGHYGLLTLRALTALWTMAPKWLAAKCMENTEFLELATLTQQILLVLEELPHGHENLELTCELLREILMQIAYLDDRQAGLLSALTGYVQKQLELLQSHHTLPLPLLQMLLQEWRTQPQLLLPVLTVLAVRHDKLRRLLLKEIAASLAQLLDMSKHNASELLNLLAVLQALKNMEQQLLLQEQQQRIMGHKLESTLLAQLPQHYELPFEGNWNGPTLSFLKQQAEEKTPQYLEICSLLLRVTCIRATLKSQTQQQLLSELQQTLQERQAPLQLRRTCIQALCTVRLDIPSSAHTQLQAFFAQQHWELLTSQDEQIMRLFYDQLPQLYAFGYVKSAQLLKVLPQLLGNARARSIILRILLCTQCPKATHAFINEDRLILHCAKCRPLPSKLPGVYQPCCKLMKQPALKFCNSTLNAICQDLLFTSGNSFIARHLDLVEVTPALCLRLLEKAPDLNALNEHNLELLIPVLCQRSTDFIKQLASHMLLRIGQILMQPLEQQTQSEQRHMLRLLVSCAQTDMDEFWLFYWFKMTFYFLVHPHSLVAQEAVLSATQICAKRGLQTVTLWNWYKRDALGLVVLLAMHAYLSQGVRFTRSLRALTKMLGFSCVQEFTCKYHRLLTTMVLPYCIKEPRCKGVIVLIAKQLRKPVSALFATSFLRLYTHVYLTEKPALGNRCVDLVVSCTSSSLQQLMNADVKQTVSELLIYFNRNPTFVMRSFQCLLQLATAENLPSQVANAEFAKFIAERFLGVITYFESCLSEQSFEKPLKEETLYSLGQIMRFVGSQHVTQFRFKIIAMLSFVHTLKEPNLQRICLKIWHIFLHVVDLQELGPSLGHIVASLQPLLAYSVEQVNSLYEFVILRNASMLGSYITDLYFLEHLDEVSAPIRQCISRHTEHLQLNSSAPITQKATLLQQLKFLHKQITNECLPVRIYGLEHLTELFAQQRMQLNSMLLHELPMEPLLEQTVNVLIHGCQHDDRKLQLASAKCLGELGAIDASYLPSNYSFESAQQLPLSVLTDDFAVLALTALCQGYQFQQKTKHVDSFSLAIQETLAVCGISPKEKRKLDLWNSMPMRMRQIMEPLLQSCYTNSQRPSSCREQPIFGSHLTHNSYEEWAFLWAARLVEYVQSSETRHLLGSYKPCIKRDGKMLSTFYPYILVHALLECDQDQREHIEQEFQAVLRAASDEVHAATAKSYEQSASSTGSYKLYESKKYAATDKVSCTERSANANEDSGHVPRLASKLCAELLDFLQRWLREWQRLHGMSTAGKPPQTVDSNYRRIHGFLERTDKLLVARASYNCGEYARALSYLEAYIEQDRSPRLLDQFSFLVEIYGRLLDADSVEGAVQARSYDLSITQEIQVNRLVERQQDMISCYEQLLCDTAQLQPEHIRAMIDAYVRMDTPKTALLIADGLWKRCSDQYTDQYFSECKSELYWRLGSYDELDQMQQQSRSRGNWHGQCAQACLALRQPETTATQFGTLLDGMRTSVLEQLRSCSAQQHHSYAHAYESVIKLHMLHELQRSQQLLERLDEPLDAEQAVQLTQNYFSDWQARLEVLQPQVRVLEPIYSFRRNLLSEMQRRLDKRAELTLPLEAELARLLLSSAQINRNAGQLQRAQLYIMKASEYRPNSLFLERAKLLWMRGDQVLAMNHLEEHLAVLKQQCQGNVSQLEDDQRTLYFEGKYLQAIYNAESMHLCADAVLQFFHDALAVQRQSERCHVQLAQFLEKMLEARQPAGKKAVSEDDEGRQLLLQIMLNYAKSLRYGSEHVYQSMPRLISLWLDTSSCGAGAELLRKMNDLMSNCCKNLNTTMFYTAYSQLLSRLCHPSPEVYSVLRDIIIKLIERYPQQSLWMLLPHFKSAVTNRIKRCKLILTDTRLQNAQFQRLLSDFNTLTERLIELTNKEVVLDRTYQLSDLDRRLSRLFNQAQFSNILLPFEKYMQPTFSISSAAATPASSSVANGEKASINWFPYQQIFISGFEEKIVVLRSAAKPKKLTIRCSDGNHYDVMVKPKDDLRKDARLMEFNGVLKRYLHQDAQARQRRLRIRTYAVLPFNEECGLLEWLPKLCSYRSICHGFYTQRGQGMSGRMLQKLTVPVTDSLERKREIFLRHLVPAHPPVFQDWLHMRFRTPHSWYEARNAYIRTVAVMSMVGYILGLGDRHGENILFDESSGEAVHVDFNCLFNQGESFAYPELVPFRLTQNMIVAMGPLGIEGSYRKCCEITLRLLKQETKTLMSVLRPLVYDLGVQSRTVAASSRSAAELTDPKATSDVRRIAERLEGHVKRHQANSIPLSIEGQVNFLINEATNLDNLAAMYIGWGAYL